MVDPKRLRSTSITFVTICLILGSVLFGPSAAIATEVMPLSLNETVRQADAIVLGTVTAKQSRWGDASQRWMVTDYSLAVEDVVYASERGIPINATLVLTYWGGTIGEDTQAISDQRLPAIGERLVLMLHPEWNQAGMTPVVGFNQGLFSISTLNGAPVVADAGGRPLALVAGRVTRRTTASDASSAPVGVSAFTGWLRSSITSIKTAPSELPPAADPNDPRVMKTPTTSPAPASEIFSNTSMSIPDALGGNTLGSPVTANGDTQAVQGTPARRNEFAELYSFNQRATAPIVVNQLPASFTPWSPEDQFQMAKWNYYASDIFRVLVTPTGTYGWGNARFDLAGWPSSTDLQNVYGTTWAGLGGNVIGVTFLRYSGSVITEADIALNPAFSFTLDDEWIYDGSSAQGFRQVMIHELGHMWGLNHNFDFMSVMNYMPGVFRAFGLPYMDDAEAIRAGYPTRAVPVTDLGVYLYYSSGFQSISDATFPGSVRAGQSFTVNNYHLENVGTATIGTPTLEWYLTTARNYNSTYYAIGNATYPSLARFTYFTPSTVGRTFTVPLGVPPGLYYVNAFIRNDVGAAQSGFPFSNNFAFSRLRIRVDPAQYTISTSVSPAGSGTASGGGLYNAGSTATVVATPAANYQFVNWTEGGSQVSTLASYSFTVTGNRSLVANFRRITYLITTGVSPAGSGTATGGGTYDAGSSATVVATPAANYQFVNWTEGGSQVSTLASYTFTVTGNRSLVANFTQSSYVISTSVAPPGSGTATGGGSYTAGSSATVSVTPNTGFQFINWTEGGSQVSTLASYTFAVTGNRSLVANFVACNLLAPTTIAPTGLISSQQPTFTWNAVTGAQDYYMYLLKTSEAYLGGLPPSPLGPLTGTSYTPASPLVGNDWTWTLAAHNSCGFGPFSPPKQFVTEGSCPLTPPVLVSPVSTVATNPVTFSWNPVTGSSIYIIFVANANTSQVVLNTSLVATSISSPDPLPAGNYAWVVYGFNSVCGASQPSSAGLFVVP